MATSLAEAHIQAQARLRAIVAQAVTNAWNDLGHYDQKNVDPFVQTVVPIVEAAQRHSVNLTDAYLGQALARGPLGINPSTVLADARKGPSPQEVYRRPFVTVWTALKGGTAWQEAVHEGLARLRSTARTDVQLAMRGTLIQAGQVDKLILGYQRVPDPGACKLCLTVAGRRYKTDALLPIHENCGCGIEPITATDRPNFTGKYANDPVIQGDDISVAVRDHGELGPVLVNAAQHFSEL